VSKDCYLLSELIFLYFLSSMFPHSIDSVLQVQLLEIGYHIHESFTIRLEISRNHLFLIASISSPNVVADF